MAPKLRIVREVGVVQAEALCRYYGDFLAVNKVSFSIKKGEIVGLLGHNGAGKTTIMKMLTGFLEPSSGRVLIDGSDIEHDRTIMQSQLGYLPENLPIYPEMIVIDYLDYVATLRGISPSQRPKAVANVIEQTALSAKALAPISALSRGYKQRLGVAQAIIHKPKILILDEPTNGLDPEQIQHMRELIKALSGETLVILSTHILQEVDAICDRAMIIRSGELVVDARLDDLRSSRHLELISNADATAIAFLVASIDGIEGWREMPSNNLAHRYHLQLATHCDHAVVAAQLAKAIVEQQFSLIRLVNVERDLESIFRQASLGHDQYSLANAAETSHAL
jgi:ABC-2 type transport system ATP-binding protein